MTFNKEEDMHMYVNVYEGQIVNYHANDITVLTVCFIVHIYSLFV